MDFCRSTPRTVGLAACVFLIGGGLDTGTLAERPVDRLERTAQAIRLADGLKLDGSLDEAAWRVAPIATGFIQAEPREGQPLTERTEVRVLFDDANLYVGAYCFDSDPAGIIINELRRDFESREGDAFGLAIDVHHDRRNSFSFFTNPGSAKRDAQALADGRYVNLQWDGVWHVASRVHADGWVAEIAIPFRTLGLRARPVQSMGINFKRRIRRKNEEGYWSPVPRRFTINYVSLAGTLTGLREINGGRGLQLKPFATADLRSAGAGPADRAKLGIDGKYRLSSGIALDLTYNTDFSHVEADTQQVNLTRFSPFFPEKREFFLENSAIFAFGDIPGERAGRNEETQLFYTRRIGLSPAGEPLPIRGGARLSGRAGAWSIGLLGMRQDEAPDIPGSTYSVARIRRDIFTRSDVGFLVVSREGASPNDFNRAYGVDLNLRAGLRWTAHGFWARTMDPESAGGSTQTKLSTKWDNGVIDGQVILADIGPGFRPETGFVPRTDVRTYQGNLGLRRRRGDGRVREWNATTRLFHVTDRDNVTLTRTGEYAVGAEFRDGATVQLSYSPQFERLRSAFELGPSAIIAPGDYRFSDLRLAYASDRSQTLSTALTVIHGDFYGGRRTTASLGSTLLIKPAFSAAVTYERNSVTLPAGEFRADLYIVRALYSFSPRLFIDALVQYNSETDRVQSTARLKFTYRPLSDFSIVFNEQRAMAPLVFDPTRALVLKYTRLLQF